MSQKKFPGKHLDQEMKKLLQEGADQLADEIEELLSREATLLVTAVLHRMTQKDWTFDEASADLMRAALVAHQTRDLIRAGYARRQYDEDHTIPDAA